MAFVRKPIPSFEPPPHRPRPQNSIKDRPLPPPPIPEDRYVKAPNSRPERIFGEEHRPQHRSSFNDRVADKGDPYNYHHNPPHYKLSQKEDSRNHRQYDDSKQCRNPLTACSNAIVSGLETFFYWLGFNIAKYPYIVIIITLLLVGGCGSGVRLLSPETDGSKLWTPSDSPAQHDLAAVRTWFPKTRRVSSLIIEADNVLSLRSLKVIAKLADEIKRINEDSYGNYNDLCSTAGPECSPRSILKFWSYNTQAVRSIPDDAAILTKINRDDSTQNVPDITRYVAGIQTDNDGKVETAKSTIMSYTTWAHFDNDTEIKLAEAWELQFLKIGEKTRDDVLVHRFAFRSNIDEGGGAIFGDIILLSSGYLLLFLFVILVLGRFNRIEHKFYISLVGLSCVVFALGVSIGIGSYANILFSPLNNILPFLLLGLGVDDMFVIVSALDNLPPHQKTATIPERMGYAMRSAGVSITITSLTDLMAFGIGIITTLPALRSFCTYCFLGILFTFIFQSTYFVAWLSIDERRADRHMDACIFCCRVKKWEPGGCSKILFVKRFFRGIYSKLITTIAARVICILLTLGFLAFGIYGTYHLRQESVWGKFIPDDSYAREYLDVADQYFPVDTTKIPASIYLGQIDYYSNFSILEDLHRNLQNNELIEDDSVDTWWFSYRGWLNATTNSNILTKLDTEKIPREEDDFYDILLNDFLISTTGKRYVNQIITSTEHRIVFSRGEFTHINLTDTKTRIKAMEEARTIVGNTKLPRKEAFAFTRRYLNYEGEKVIQEELYRNIGLAFLSAAIITLLLIANFLTSFFICICVILTVVDTGGLMYFWGLNIDTVTSIILIVAMGLSIDFSAHIGHMFLTTKGKRVERVRRSLTLVGPAVFFGGFSTCLAFILLIFSKSYVFQTFFKVFLGVVAFGLFHGLALLPVVLSLIGPRPYPTAHHDPDEEDDSDVGRQGWNDKIYIPPQFWEGVRYGSPPSRSDRSQGPLSSGNSGDTGVYSAGHLYRTRLQQERTRQADDQRAGYSPSIIRQQEYVPRATAFSSRQYGNGHPGSVKVPGSMPPLRVYVKPADYVKPSSYIKPSKRKSKEEFWPVTRRYPP